MEVQALMQQAREMLASQGAPVTTDNLNRAMLMLTGTGDTRTEQTAEGFDMNAQVDRVMQRSGAGTQRRANVPRNAQPSAQVGAAGTAPDENAVPDMTLPMPPPDVATAAQEAGQRVTIIPGEGTMYTAPNGPTSSLDGNGMQNRLLRDLVMGTESAGAVSGSMPMRGAATASRTAPTTPTPPSLSQVAPTAQRVTPTADEIAALPPAQRAALMGPTPAGNAAMAAVRQRAGGNGGPRGSTTSAQRQRTANRANASN